jgi:hypothetical protein
MTYTKAMDYVRPIVNLNGTSRESLIQQAFDVSGAAEALIQALGRAAPHGRDYQTVGNKAYERDRELWEKFVGHARDIFDAYRNTGETLFLEGEERKRK